MGFPNDTWVLDIAKPFVKAREGFRAAPYLDQAGLPTIGYGTRFYPSGKAVQMRDGPIDTGYAEVCLTSAMMKVLDQLRICESRAPTAHQAAAILSLAYNVGYVAIQHSTLMRLFNEGDDAGAANQFLRWDHVRENGEEVEDDGLYERRDLERSLYLTPDN